MKRNFEASQRLIKDQPEISGVSRICWQTHLWEGKSLLCGKAVRLVTARVNVFSDSVLCLGKVNTYPQSNAAWESKLEWFKSTHQYKELDRIDGKPMEFEWNIFLGFTTLQILTEIQRMLSSMSCEPEQFNGRVIFMSMYNDIIWRDSQNKSVCITHSIIVTDHARKFPLGHWSFVGPGSETKRYRTDTFKPKGKWDEVAEIMMMNFRESGHPVFRATSAMERGTLKRKGGGNLSIHFCCDYETAEVIFCTIVSVNQLSINGPVADLCEELALSNSGNPLAGTGGCYGKAKSHLFHQQHC